MTLVQLTIPISLFEKIDTNAKEFKISIIEYLERIVEDAE